MRALRVDITSSKYARIMYRGTDQVLLQADEMLHNIGSDADFSPADVSPVHLIMSC